MADRIIQQAIAQQPMPIYKSLFPEISTKFLKETLKQKINREKSQAISMFAIRNVKYLGLGKNAKGIYSSPCKIAKESQGQTEIVDSPEQVWC